MKFVIATGNPDKVREFQEILEPLGIQTVGSKAMGITLEQEETGDTFGENARIKAREVFEKTGLPTIADDSGLCVDALDGAPGVHSARFGGENLPQEKKNQRLLELLHKTPDEQRTARFVCHIHCILTDIVAIDAEGIGQGKIGYAPMGEGGFGYDPLFMVGQKSYAQLSPEEKNAISHRGNALRDFVEQLKIVLPQYKEIL